MSDQDELSRQLGALAARVAALEAEVSQLRTGALLPAESQRLRVMAEQPSRIETHAAADSLVTAHAGRSAHVSLESRIGSQLFNRIGIIALLIGAAWFLKFAIDNHWLGPLARVLLGIVAGAGIIAGSEVFRARGYKAFSYSLKALGTGLLYLSVWAAYTLFALIPVSLALAAMILITAANAWLCWRQNSEVLAFYAAVGGFLTPVLLSAAESHEITLFTYLLLLDLAVLALVALRPWSRLLLASFAGTAMYAVGWYVQHYSPAAFGITAFYVVTFFLLFSAAPQLLRNLRMASTTASLTFEDNLALILLPLLNALLAFAELYALLSEPVSTPLRAWVAFGFSAFYLGMLRVARMPRLAGTPTRLQDTYLLLSVLAFTGAIPLAFHSRLVAVCWSAESVLLFAFAWRLAGRILRVTASAVLGLAFTATLSFNSELHGVLMIVWNSRFATYLAGVAASAFAAWVASRALQQAAPEAKARGAAQPASSWRLDGILASVEATVLLMVGVCLEISAYWNSQYQLARSERLLDEQFSYSAWTMLFGAAMLAAGFGRKVTTLRWLGLLLLALSTAKVFLFDLRVLSQGYRILSFLGLGALLLGVSFVYQRDLLGLRKPQ